jgi:hypothetical protein
MSGTYSQTIAATPITDSFLTVLELGQETEASRD